MYSARLLDHFEHPRHAGDLPEANARVRIENPACGDILELAAEVENGMVRAIRFRAKGCVPAMACASALAELANGESLTTVAKIQKEDVLREVDGVPPASGHAAQLAVDALRALLGQRAASAY
jgi:nitrogen fixation protein NifU and related proteins